MRRLLMTLTLTPMLLGLTTVAASAADPVIELSRDGVHWYPNLTQPLFDPAMRWVPGDRESASFYVRNGGGTKGDLTLDVVGGQTDELIESGDLDVTASAAGGQSRTISGPGTHRILTAKDLADGKVAKVTVTVDFDGRSQSPTQLDAAQFAFRVTMSRAQSTLGGDGVAGEDAEDGDTGMIGSLPDTGAPTWLRASLFLGAILVGSGIALLIDARRERRHG